jgi:hypothetical protein
MNDNPSASLPVRRGPLFGSAAALFILGAAGCIAEAIVLQAFGFSSALPLAPQVSAPAPFGVFHDLRWVWTYAWSWPSAVWQLAALWVFRSSYDAALIGAAWPQDRERPSFPVLWRRSGAYTAIAIVVMSPWATYSFAAGATSYGPFLVAAIFASLLTALVMPPGVITGQWWRRIMPWRTMPHIALAWLVLMLASLATMFSPAWFTVVVAAAGGLINAWLWRRIVATVTAAELLPFPFPITPVAVALVVGGFVAGGGYWYGRTFAAQASKQDRSTQRMAQKAPQTSVVPVSEAVIFVDGFDTAYDGKTYNLLGPDVRTRFFSYAGLGADGKPLPYQPGDTYGSLEHSADLLAQQVDKLSQLSGGPVAIVADSEGTVVARTYLARAAQPPVDHYIEASPLLRPAWVYYPPAGESGFGLLGGWEAREIFRLVQIESPHFTADVDIPFLRSTVDDAPLLRNQVLCTVPHVPTFLFVPLQAALMMPRGVMTRMRWATLPGWHGTLLEHGVVQHDIQRLLGNGGLAHRPGWKFWFQLVRGAAAAWHPPALPLSFPPWHGSLAIDPAFGHYGCPAGAGSR